MPFLPGLGEKIALSLAMDLVKASASKVKRFLSATEAQKTIEASIAAALDEALAAQNLGEIDHDHYAGLFERYFHRQAVIGELVRVLDPRPGIEPDFTILSDELADEIDTDFNPHFEPDAFLHAFVSAFYAAAASEATLQGVLGIKLQGIVAKETSRTADAAEEIVRLLHRFLADRSAEPALVQAGRAALNQGFLGALQAYEVITAEMNRAGYGLGVGDSGAIEISGAVKVLPPAQEQIIRSLAADLRRTVLDATPGPAEIDALEARFRQHVIRWFESLQFQGLMRTPRAILLPLEEVYVELRAVAEVPEAADAFSVEERRLLLEIDEKGDSGRRELMSQLDALRRERWSRTLPERQSIAASLHQRDRRAFVILGDPGSGKSTLLHFLALVYARGPEAAAARLKVDPLEADRLPIFAPLAAFDDMLRQSPGLTLTDFLPLYYDRRRGLPGLGPLFRRALQSGRALVLLDGLDEVLDTGTRAYVAQQAGALIQEWSPRGVRFAVSSRFVGYREAALPGNLPTLSVLDFGPPEIEIFVRQWAHAYEKWAAEGVESPEMLRAAQKLAADLLTDVRSNDSVRRLAANPLLLTMLALLRRQVGRLPHRRVQLYESYIGALLETWVDARSEGNREQSIAILDRHQAENLLIPLALWLQQEKPSGTAGGEELRRKLVDICLAERGLTASAPRPQILEAEKEATRFLREMRQLTGLLVERGHDAFGFLHLTFQEYFAGRALARLDPAERDAILRPHLHDPRWREPLLLCAGRLGVTENRRAQVTDLVRAILDCPDPTEEKLHRNLLLALSIAGDDVNLEPAVMTEMVGRAVACLETNVYALARNLTEALGQLVANGAVGVEECFGKVCESKDWRLRKTVVEALGRFAGVEEVRSLLLAWLDKKEHWLVVEATLVALTSQMAAWKNVRVAALKLLSEGNLAAAEALKDLAASDDETQSALMEKLASSDEKVRTAAVRALSSSATKSETVKLAIMDRLDDPYPNVSRESVVALASSAGRDQAVRTAILAKLAGADTPMQEAVVAALVDLIDSDEAVAQALAMKLFDGYSSVRKRILAAFAEFLEISDDVRRVILLLLRDPVSEVRQEAVQALTGLLWQDQEVTQSFLGLLETGNEQDKRAVLHSLSAHRVDRPQISALFTEHARSREWRVRERVAEALGETVCGVEDLENLVQILRNRDTWEVLEIFRNFPSQVPSCITSKTNWRNYWKGKVASTHREELAATVTALAGSVALDPACRQLILDALESHEYSVFQAALKAVVGLVRAEADIRTAVLRRLGEGSSYLRGSILTELSSLVEDDLEFRRLALTILKEKRDSEREEALEALSGLVEKDNEVKAAVLERLEDESGQVRHAALRALTHLAEMDPVVQATILKCVDRQRFDTWQWALQALAGSANVNNEVRILLLDGLRSEDRFVRDATLRVASRAAQVDSEICGIIIDQLEGDNFVGSALRALTGVIEVNERARRAALDKLIHKNRYTRVAALETLEALAGQDLEVRAALLERLKDEDSYVRYSTVRVLEGVARTEPEVEAAVLAKLEDEDEGVRQQAVKALSGTCGVLTVVTGAIRNRLADQRFEVRATAVDVITRRLPENLTTPSLLAQLLPWLAINFDREATRELDPWIRQRILTQLPQLLEPRLPGDAELRAYLLEQLREPDWAARCGAALALLVWPDGPPDEVLESIFKALDDPRGLEAYPAQLAAASFLVNRNNFTQEAVNLCLEALNYGARPWQALRESREVRKRAALVLGKLEPLYFEERIYDKLLHVMENDEDGTVRDAAYGTLVRLARFLDVDPAPARDG